MKSQDDTDPPHPLHLPLLGGEGLPDHLSLGERSAAGRVRGTALSDDLRPAKHDPLSSLPSAYPSLVLDHFQHPHHVGRLPAGPDVVEARAGSRAEGVEVLLTFRSAAGRVVEICFQAFACPHILAAASLITERLVGRTLEELRDWHALELEPELNLPVEKRGRLLILEDAVHAAAQYAVR